MATGQDVRDILAIPSGGQNASASSSSSNAPGGSGSVRQAATARSGTSKKKKPARVDGISRELYALLGDNTPSLTFAQNAIADGAGGGLDGGEVGKFRPKFKRTQKVQKWVPAKFRNPARNDDLVLRHWISVGEEEEERRLFAEKQAGQQQQKQRTQQKKRQDDAANGGDGMLGEDEEEDKPDTVPRVYRFADLSTNSGVYRYSNDEYHQHLRDEDWTKEETDYLIDLCTAYDLRFVIVTDRYEWPGKQRTMEDIKARYYAICRRLIRSRISTDDIDARQQLVLTYSYDRVREQERKKHVARLFSRTPQQLAEEEALYVEARRLEQNEARFAAEREELLRLLGGWERLPNVRSETVAAAGSGVGGGPTTSNIGGGEDEGADASRNRSRKRKASESVAGAAEASTLGGMSTYSTAAAAAAAAAATGAPLTSKQKAELRAAQFDELHNIVRFDPQASIAMANAKPPYPHLTGTPSTYPPTSTNPTSSHGVYLRSTRMLAPRSNLALRTQESLAELRPPVSLRLTFPTRANCEKWEGVVGAVTSGLEMKRQLDRVQSEVRINQMRAQQQQQQSQSQTLAPSSAISGTRSGTAGARSVTPQILAAASTAPTASAPASTITTDAADSTES